MISFGSYATGFLGLMAIVGALGTGAWILRRRFLPGWTGSVARLVEIVVGVSALIFISEILGVLGLLNIWWLVGVSVFVSAAVWYSSRGTAATRGTVVPKLEAPRWTVVVAGLVAGFVVFHWAIPVQQAYEVGMYSQDTVWYHMSFAGRMAQEGAVGPLLFTDILATASWFYPQNAELLHAVGIVLFDQDVLSPLLNLLWLCLTLLAGWCIGRPRGVAWLTLLATAIVLDTPMMLEQAGNAANDITSVAFLLAMAAILVNGEAGGSSETRVLARRSPFAGIGWEALAVAGLAAGLAIGTKLTLLAVVGVLTVLLIALSPRGNRLATAGVWLGALAVTSGFWYVRNLVEGANPLPQVSSIGPISLPGPVQAELYPRKPATVAHYLDQPKIWFEWFFPALHDRLGPLWPLILLVVVGGLGFGVVRGRTAIVRILSIVGLVAAVAYLGTPLTASGNLGFPSGFAPNLRYFAPALILAFALSPLLLSNLSERSKRIAGTGLVLVLVIGTISQAVFKPGKELRPSRAELERLAEGEQDGYRSFRQDTYVSSKLPGALLLALLLVGLPVGTSLAVSSRPENKRFLVACGIAVGVVSLAGVGWAVAPSYARDRYDPSLVNPFERESGFRASPDWRRLQGYGRELEGERIAVVGRAAAFGQYIFYGPKLDNHVQYLGATLATGTYRPIESCPVFKKLLKVGRYRYLVITPRQGEEAFSVPIEKGWIETDPAAEKVVAAGSAGIYEITGNLDPGLCPGGGSQ